MGKHQEANELITYHDNYNFDNVLQGNVISLVNYHHCNISFNSTR